MRDAVQIGKTLLRLVHGDITEAVVEVVVNAANRSLLGGGGVDGAIHRRGGTAILEECKRLRRDVFPEGVPTAEAVLTTGGQLYARHVIHTVGPIWQGGDAGEPDLLVRAYRNVLDLARMHRLRTLAFPSISTGAYGFPIHQAAPLALQTIAEVVRAWPNAFDEVQVVLFTGHDLTVYQNALPAAW
jgi:O-acetyl-ADP-ribose deacetylase (regulator of RNase III)